MFKSSNKGISTPLGIVIILIVAILAGGVLIYKYYSTPKGEVKLPELKIPEKVTEDETADWRIYTNSELGYSIKYPKDWYVKEEYRTKYSLENLYIENMKEKVIIAGGGPFTENGSSFNIVILEAPNISSIEEWIQSGDLPDREKQRRLNSVTNMEISGIIRNV